GALLAFPALRFLRSVPMDVFLRTFAPILIARRTTSFGFSALDLIALASARTADRAVLSEILEGADAESPRVLLELSEMAIRARAVILGIDLRRAIETVRIPVAAVVGSQDILAPRTSSPILSPAARGPRLVIEVPDALHVDLLVGSHARHLALR